METLGFRRPQFSEGLAWLPGWVQHQVEQFDECIEEPPGSSKLESKVSALFQGSTSVENDVVLLSKEESRHNNYHLFLSGEDNSSSIFTSSARNLHFHLHLSSDGFSQLSETDRVLSMNNFETSLAAKENTRSKASFSPGGLNILPQSSSPEPCPNYTANSKDSMRHCGEKSGLMRLKDAEINDAVKLSIAASEALVIHEIAKSRSELNTLAITETVEVSLRLKQARLEWLDDAFNFSMEDTCENDSLSDLDDFAMTDAFEDIGLICSPFDEHVSALAISCVKETPAAENQNICANHPGYTDLFSQQVNFDDVSAQEKSENIINSDAILAKSLPCVSLNDESQKKLSDDPISCSCSTSMLRENNPSTPKDPPAMDVEQFQIIGSAMEDLTSSQAQIKERMATCNSSLGNTREDMKIYPVSERFKSRWLGGWTEKVEVNASPQLKHNNAEFILKAFACETSFLSESADIAPDENSLVQIPEVSISEIQSHGVSISSQAIEGYLDKANMEIFLSQDVVSSSSLSLDDPLCSVVPCSLSLENTNSTEAQHHNNVETGFGRDFRPVVELEMGNSSKISGPNVDFHYGDGKFMHTVDKVSKGTVRKHMTSLKTYSTLLPNSVSISDGSLHYNRSCQSQFIWGHLTSSKNIEDIRASDKCNSSNSSGKENEEFCEAVENSDPVEKLIKKNASNLEIARDGDGLPVQSPKERMQPLLLDPRIRHRVQASKSSAVNFSRGEHSKQTSGVKNATRLQQIEKTQKTQSAYKNSHDRVKKRVRFSEAEAQIEPDVQEPHSSRRTCSNIAASKKLKYIDRWSDYQNCEERFLKCCSSVGKLCMLQGMQFLLTGLSSQKGKDVKGQIQKHGGIILSDIPSPSNVRGNRFSTSYWHGLPIILSSRKQQTAKFLYGCAVNAFILHVDWLTSSIRAGSLLPPEKYLILPHAHIGSIVKQVHDDDNSSIFENVGIMLHGKRSFCTKLAKIVKHGGGRVFKTIQWLVQSLDKGKISMGAIVTEDENTASRHLRQCACEWQIPMMPASWIVMSLYSGKLLPLTE